MDSKLETSDPPAYAVDTGDESSKEILKPAVLLLAGESILVEDTAFAPMYHLSRSVTSFSPKQGSSVLFQRVEHDVPEEITSIKPGKQRSRDLFYLAHPVDADYRDIPAYYITSISPGGIGNVHFEMSKPLLQKTAFRAMLSANKSAADESLFDDKAQQKLLFSAKSKWVSGRYRWTNSNGGEIAFEDTKGDQHKLVVTAPMPREMRDALVAMWALRLWHDTAESRHAKREVLESLTPPPAVGAGGNQDMKLAKRMGALAVLGGG